jgi:hypothetical protein
MSAIDAPSAAAVASVTAAAAAAAADASAAAAEQKKKQIPPSSAGRLVARLGVLSDIQYADVDDGHNFTRTERRYYRNALRTTARAVQRMRGHGTATATEAMKEEASGAAEDDDDDDATAAAAADAFAAASLSAASGPIVELEWRCQAVLHLGDLVDGFNATAGPGRTHRGEEAVRDIMDVLPRVSTERCIPSLVDESQEREQPQQQPASAPAGASKASDDLRCYHLLGNHELINFPRSRWARELAFAALSEESRREAAEWARDNPLPSHAPKRTYMFPTDADAPPPAVPALAPGQPIAATASVEAEAAAAAATAAASSSVTSATPLYYDLLVGGLYRFVMLDAFDVCVSGYSDVSASSPEARHYRLASAFLASENPNDIKYSPEGLLGTERRKVAFNGGMGQEQLEWLETVLRRARAQGEWAVLCSHVAFHEGASDCVALLWNREEVLRLLRYDCATDSDSSSASVVCSSGEFTYGHDVVVACLHGHDHDGGHAVDELVATKAAGGVGASSSSSSHCSSRCSNHTGVVHHTFEGVLTTPVGQDTYGRMDLYEHAIEVTGVDRLSSFSIDLTNKERLRQQCQQKQQKQQKQADGSSQARSDSQAHF